MPQQSKEVVTDNLTAASAANTAAPVKMVIGKDCSGVHKGQGE